MVANTVRDLTRNIVRALRATAACALAIPLSAGAVEVVEFYNASLQHYFISADAAEIAVLDGGAFGGAWARTGSRFNAWDVAGAPADAVAVCRFFGTDRYRANGTRIGPNSHFYTADAAECANTRVAFQSVAIDGISYPAWTFESHAFAAKLPAGGTCPAGTQSLFRTYNNGARGDPNHRYSTQPEVLQAMAGWVFEGLVMCVQPGATPTGTGVPVGALTTATIGPGGGTLASPDGKLTITVPPGALAAATVIGLQAHTNTAHGSIGAAYRLTPEGQAFAQPVTLTFAYSDDDLLGTGESFIGAAWQTADGFWKWAGEPTINATAKTLSVTTSHFSFWSRVKILDLAPASKLVKVNTVQAMVVRACIEDSDFANLGTGTNLVVCTPLPSNRTVDQWSVNGVLGGGPVFGRVAAVLSGSANYTAPANEPTPNTVAVSARVPVLSKGTNLVSSRITITEDAWVGTATSDTPGAVFVSAQVVWTLDKTVNNVSTYVATGTVTVNVPLCTISPDTNVIDPAVSEVLVVDYNTTPATYHGAGAASWSATWTCQGLGVFVAPTPGGFFGGSKGTLGTEAQGVVSPDGKTIEGTDVNRGTTFRWKFERNKDPG